LIFSSAACGEIVGGKPVKAGAGRDEIDRSKILIGKWQSNKYNNSAYQSGCNFHNKREALSKIQGRKVEGGIWILKDRLKKPDRSPFPTKVKALWLANR
jgi:hypothetical protein